MRSPSNGRGPDFAGAATVAGLGGPAGRRRVAGRRCGLAEPDVPTVDRVVPGRDGAAHAGDEFGIGDRADGPEVLGGQDLRGVQHGGYRHAVRLSLGDKRFHRLLGEQSLNQHADLRPRLEPRSDDVVLGVLELRRLAEPAPQPVPLSRRHHAQPDVAVPAGVDRVGVLVLGAPAPPIADAGPPRRPARARRTPGRAPSRRPRSGRSRCSRLRHNVTGCSRRPARTRRPGPPRSPRRCRPAATPGCRWWARTAPTPRTTRRAPDRWPATTTAVRSCRNRSPTAPPAAGIDRPARHTTFRTRRLGRGLPLSTTMSALPASSISRSRSSGSAGSSTALRLFALCSAKRTLVPRSARPAGACRAAAGRLDLQHVGAQVGEQPGDRVAVAVAQVEHPQRREQVVRHQASVVGGQSRGGGAG